MHAGVKRGVIYYIYIYIYILYIYIYILYINHVLQKRGSLSGSHFL